MHVVGAHLFALEVFLSGQPPRRPECRPKGSSDADVILEACRPTNFASLRGEIISDILWDAHCRDVGETE